jgi:hypothetical protein
LQIAFAPQGDGLQGILGPSVGRAEDEIEMRENKIYYKRKKI